MDEGNLLLVSSSLTCRTHATHQLSSYIYATKPLMSSNASSFSRIETRSFLEAIDSE